MANMSMMDFLKNVLAQIGLIHANQTSASQTEYGKLQASAFDDMMEKAKEKGVTKAQSLFTLANELGFQPLHIAQGDIMNFKLTYPNDILIYQALKTLEE
jgi:hypothetical protein